ncbi:Formin-binding protein 1 [Chytridiales sp. JEL 0842]|nr:Formin-binding protein 1 [Chytridiales sp. JEL 0842]
MDQWQEVERYTSEGVHSMMSLNEFMKKRSDIEAEYARSLQRLTKTYKDELARKATDKRSPQYNKAVTESTMHGAWTQVLAEADNVANHHLLISEKLNTELRKTIKYQAQDNEKKFKERFDEVKKANAELQKQVTTMEKLREKFDMEKVTMETARQNYEKAFKNPKLTEKDVAAARSEAEKRASIATEVMEQYQKSIDDTNEKKTKHFTVVLPTLLNEIQSEDENHRIRATKVALNKYHELLASIQPGIDAGLENISVAFQKISAEYDSQIFVSSLRTGDSVPEDYVFEEKAVARDGNLKRAGSVRSGSAKSPPDVEHESDDAILSESPKKGRKLAADRVKQMEKEVVELEKKKQAVESLLSVYAQKPPKDPKYQTELLSQRANIDIKLDNIGIRKHRLQVFIAEIDNTPIPDLPSNLVGKSIQSPTSPSDFAAMHMQARSTYSPTSYSPAHSTGTPTSVGGAHAGPPAHGEMSPMRESTEMWGKPQAGQGICKAKMLYDFEAAPGSQEVSAPAGLEFDVLEKQDDGWWKARLFVDGEWKEGFVPGNYTEEI